MKNLNGKKQEDLGDTPNKRKTPPTPFQTETGSKRASVAMRIIQAINSSTLCHNTFDYKCI